MSDVMHASHADFIFIRDREKREWIYKQITEKSSDDQMAIVLETVASDIARSLGIPLNHAIMVGPTEEFNHRIFENCPGSLHLKVGGKPVVELSPWEGFDLHQKFRTPFMEASKGPLNPEEVGLRREIITTIAKHEDLQKIVAFDTYLGNIDRSDNNIFYDASHNRFYGIDMGNCLMGPLPGCALKQLEQFFSQLSMEEKQGLKGYKDSLGLLVKNFPPAKLIALLNQHLEKAGLTPNDEDSIRKFNKWNKLIENNYLSSLKLISYLDNNL